MSLSLMKQRLGYYGGAQQQDRMVRDKLKSMLSAIKYSYQAAKFNKWEDDKTFKGLFNPITQTENYDTKRISVPFDSGVKVGNILHWQNTNSYWIIFLQDKDELSYFRGQCRRCDYVVQWVDKNRILHKAPVSVIGPTNPQLGQMNIANSQIDIPTGNIALLTQDNPIYREYFTRYQKILLKGKTYKIEMIDNISMPGVIQINASEYYTERIQDGDGIRNSYNVQPLVEHHNSEYGINGPRMIKPYFEAEYQTFVPNGYWVIQEVEELPPLQKNKFPAQIIDQDNTQKKIHLKWSSPKTGNFTLEYHTENKTYQFNIIVQSLM